MRHLPMGVRWRLPLEQHVGPNVADAGGGCDGVVAALLPEAAGGGHQRVGLDVAVHVALAAAHLRAARSAAARSPAAAGRNKGGLQRTLLGSAATYASLARHLTLCQSPPPISGRMASESTR